MEFRHDDRICAWMYNASYAYVHECLQVVLRLRVLTQQLRIRKVIVNLSQSVRTGAPRASSMRAGGGVLMYLTQPYIRHPHPFEKWQLECTRNLYSCEGDGRQFHKSVDDEAGDDNAVKAH